MTAPPQTLDAAAEAPAAARAPLRLVVVPTPQPPLVDPHLAHPLVLPGVAVPRPPLRPGPRPRPERSLAADGDFGPAYSGRADLPDVRVAARRLVTLVLEAFGERRPMTQLRPVTSNGLFAAVSSGRRPGWCTEGRAPFAVGPVHVCEPVDGVAEISAVVRRNGRAHAVAARLEGIDGRWLCTALQIG
jgi:hypothetical protein